LIRVEILKPDPLESFEPEIKRLFSSLKKLV
jgi:hypothetical protein